MRKENILMKEKKYYDLVSSFSELDLEDKKEEVLKHSDEDEYFNLLFTYIISLKEENAKLIDKLNEFGI